MNTGFSNQGVAAAGLTQLNTSIIQLGYVTDDLERAAAWFVSDLGARGFDFFERGTTTEAILDGEVADEWVIAVAGTMMGEINVELIQPVSGPLDLYTDVLVPGAPATFHHYAFAVDEWAQAEAARETLDVPWAVKGHTPGVCDFGYIDLRPVLGHYVEYLRLEPGTIGVLEDLKRKYGAARA